MFHVLSFIVSVVWILQGNWKKKSETWSNFNYDPACDHTDRSLSCMFSNKQEKLPSKIFLCTTGPLITGSNLYFWYCWNVNNQNKTFSSLCLRHSTEQNYYLTSMSCLIVNLKKRKRKEKILRYLRADSLLGEIIRSSLKSEFSTQWKQLNTNNGIYKSHNMEKLLLIVFNWKCWGHRWD